MPSIIEAMDDPALFGSWFQGPSWQPWRSFLRVAFGLPLSDQDLALFKQCTGRTMPRQRPSPNGGAWLAAVAESR